MTVEALRTQIEPFLDSKGYRPEQTARRNCKSYIETLLKFMAGNNYDELTESVISEYMKAYEGKPGAVTRENRIDEFRNYVQGVSNTTMSLPLEYEEKKANEAETDSDVATGDDTVTVTSDESESSDAEQQEVQPAAPLVSALKKRGRKPKAENENRTQISAYLSNEVYAGIKALSVTTQQPISDIVSQVMNVFYEDNLEVIKDSIRTVQLSESINSRIKYHR